MGSFFSDIECYSFNKSTSKENLFTEILKFILLQYKPIRKEFLALICKKHRLLAGQMSDSDIDSQVRLKCSNRLMDVCFEIKGGKRIWLENKIDAKEGRIDDSGDKKSHPQIKGYLSKMVSGKDYLAYITRKGRLSPKGINSKDGRYSGHFYWEDIGEIVEKHSKRKSCLFLQQFMKYMEDNKMKSEIRLTERELRNSETAFSYITKAEQIIGSLMSDLIPCIKKNFGADNWKMAKSTFNREYEFVGWFYKIKKWNIFNTWFFL